LTKIGFIKAKNEVKSKILDPEDTSRFGMIAEIAHLHEMIFQTAQINSQLSGTRDKYQNKR
jgi:hypothetical protein